MAGAAILLSGGMDSIALAYWKRPSIAVTVDYGQRPAEAEIQAAASVCAALGIRQNVVRVDCRAIGSGDLAGTTPLDVAPVPEWWPYRNQLLVTFAAASLLRHGVDSIMLGTVRTDVVHADGTPEFVEKLSTLLAMQEGAVRVEAPAAQLSSVELIRESRVPLEVLAWAHSCHVANFACGNCRGCNKHFNTMRELGYVAY